MYVIKCHSERSATDEPFGMAETLEGRFWALSPMTEARSDKIAEDRQLRCYQAKMVLASMSSYRACVCGVLVMRRVGLLARFRNMDS